jgi:hypothetical protein
MKAMHSDGLPAEIAEAFDAVQKQADACADEWNRRHAQIVHSLMNTARYKCD